MEQLCFSCREIFNKKGVLDRKQSFVYVELGLHMEPYIRHHSDINGLEDSVNSGCPICFALWRSLSVQDRASLCRDSYDGSAYFIRSPILSYRLFKIRDFYSIEFRLQTIRKDYIEKRFKFQPLPVMGLLDHTQTIAATNTGSEEVLRLATQWISDCVESHQKCQGKEPTIRQLPTRLVAVGPAGSPTGTINFLKLTTQNHARFEDSINMHDLPTTFQDAITFTRRAAIGYIWIDSLCILQDSEEDWQYESLRMENVYSNAYCNIAATAGSHPQAGCFVERDVKDCLPVTFSSASRFYASLSAIYQTVSHIVSTDLTPSVGIDPGKYICHEEKLWEREITDSTLMRRAWVFQERFLAKRVLHFASSQIFFECCTVRRSEICPGNMNYPYYSTKKSKSNFAEGLGVPFDSVYYGLGENPSLEPLRIWVLMVEGYTACAMTFETDRLTAIAGLARYMKPILKCRYLAGLWKDSLVLQLLWRSAGDCKRPNAYLAPSWSWASVSGQVFSALVQSPSYMWDGFPPGGRQPIRIQDVEVKTIDGNEMSKVTYGCVRLTGHLTPVRLEYPVGIAPAAEGMAWIRVREWLLQFIPDVIEEISGEALSQKYYCTPFFHGITMTGSEYWVQGLVLCRSGEKKGQYRRVGYFTIDRKSDPNVCGNFEQNIAGRGDLAEKAEMIEDLYESYDEKYDRYVFTII